jgi:trk system potassium uptake protein TrkH
MNYRMLGYLLSIVMLLEAALLTFPLITALIYSESVVPFLITMAILVAVSLPSVIFKPKNTTIYAKEGFICVAASWMLMSFFGALPFLFSGVIQNYVDAVFEIVSGFTTTGATILREIEGLPRGILLWRSFSHWVGGMGVLVFMLAILPSTDGRAIHLLRAEVPGPTKGKLVPKLRQTAIILYGMYVFLTLLEFVILLFTGMSPYDALVSTFSTAGTGGFSVKNISIAGYNNPAAEWVIAIFMLIFGVNFNLYYLILLGKVKDIFKSEEFRAYLAVFAVACTLIAINTFSMFANLSDCIRATVFQVTSIMSTTGFSTVDFNLWPEFSKSIILILTVFGACAGSTAGGLKMSRILILAKTVAKEIRHLLKPRSVNTVRLDGEAVGDETTRAASNYFVLYAAILIVTVLLISLDGFDFQTNFTAALTCLNNVGPGLGAVGPLGNFADYSAFSKILLSLAMLFGRLEIMPMVILFSPLSWRK